MRPHIFAAAALEHQPHPGVRLADLMKMERGRAGTAVGAVILARERIHGILSQIPFFCGEGHRLARGLSKADLVVADGAVHIKQDAAGVLAEGLGLGFRQRDVLVNDLDGIGRQRILLLVLERRQQGPMHVVRNFGGRAADQFNQGIMQ